MPLTPHSRLGAYEILGPLGAGGMGEVYRAHDARLGREVALKILPPEVTSQPGRLARFDREARAIAALNHPHIVTIYSTEEADGVRFLTMELVDGYPLSDLVLSTGMAIPRFLDIGLPLADALDAAHQKQITHRDLKPSNVMVSHDGRVKVLDFGLARVGSSDATEINLDATADPISQDGKMIGTVPDMSPEQVEGLRLDSRSDLFSLGVVFYELLAGHRPFKGPSSAALMSAILRDTPPTLCEQRADVPDAINRLVSRLLEKRPEDRVQTARDVFNELRHIKSGGTTPGTARVLSEAWSSSGSGAGRRGAPSVAVLPFETRSADDESRALADGLTDDITSGLSRFGYIRVLSRSMAERLSREHTHVQLQARYAIEGNVRRAGSTIRASVTLVDTQAGTNLWTTNYDRDASEGTFTIQDAIASAAVATIGDTTGVLMQAMYAALVHKPLGDLSVAELVVRFHFYAENIRPDEHLRLRDALELALEREASAAEGWACLSMLYEHEHGFGFNQRPNTLERQRLAAQKAIEINPHSQLGWVGMARAQVFARDLGALNAAIERVVTINPLNADMVALTGLFLSLAGEYDRGSVIVRGAMERKPEHPGWYHFPMFNYHFTRGEYEAALREVKAVNMPMMPLSYLAAAAVSGHLGRAAEARLAFAALRSINTALLDPDVARAIWAIWVWDEDYIEKLVEGFKTAIAITADAP